MECLIIIDTTKWELTKWDFFAAILQTMLYWENKLDSDKYIKIRYHIGQRNMIGLALKVYADISYFRTSKMHQFEYEGV